MDSQKIVDNIIGKEIKTLKQESTLLKKACPKCKGTVEYVGVNLFGLHEYHCLECDTYWGTPIKMTGKENWQ